MGEVERASMGRKSKRLNGWRKAAQSSHYSPILPSGPTKWEMMLYRMGMEEKDVMNNPQKVAVWVRKNAGSVFVPEKVLMELGIETRWVV